jgi:hypothetical protein
LIAIIFTVFIFAIFSIIIIQARTFEGSCVESTYIIA